MCTIFFGLKVHKKYPLIILGNRDEFKGRPSQKIHKWAQGFFAGKDLLSGGTWGGINQEGAFAFLTNYRKKALFLEDAPSRGRIPYYYLSKDHQAFDSAVKNGLQDNPYNLLYGDLDNFYYFNSQFEKPIPLSEGIHGLSNGLLNEPWPKVMKGKRRLSYLLKSEDPAIEEFFELLSDAQEEEDLALLPDNTGFTMDQEKAMSALYIKGEAYGTISQYVLLVQEDGKAVFAEGQHQGLMTKIHFTINK